MTANMLLVLSALAMPAMVTCSSLRGGASEEFGFPVYALTAMTDKFLDEMGKKETSLVSIGMSEEDRLSNALMNAPNPEDKSLLETTAQVSALNKLESQNVLALNKNFANTVRQMLGAVSGAESCDTLTCGSHAHCAMESRGARCNCNAGFTGNGFVCRTPLELKMSPLFKTAGQAPNMADLKVSTLQGDVVLATYRDISKDNKGYVMLGRAAPEGMQWHSPVAFSNESAAFSPVLVQLKASDQKNYQGEFAIAFRNADRGGNGLLLGGKVHPTSGAITLGSPKAFARHQAQAMSLVSLPDSHVAVIYAEHAPRVNGDKALDMYGTSLLAHFPGDGQEPEIKSKDRFASGPVARISVSPISPTSFGIAYRQGADETSTELSEAAAIVGEFHSNSHIRFNSAVTLLEPSKAHILARSLSLIGENTLAYTYHSADEKVTKQAILRNLPKSHKLEIVHGPEVLAEGFTGVLDSVSLIDESAKKGSLILTMLGHAAPKPAEARLCRMSKDDKPSNCVNIAWDARNLASVSATQVSDGRFLLLMTDSTGNPYYQLAGLTL